jgi:hypothetical protein
MLLSSFSIREDLFVSINFTGGGIRVQDDNIPLAHIFIAVESTGWVDANYNFTNDGINYYWK